MRFVDVLYSLPYLFVVIILTTLFPRGSLAVLSLSLAAVGWLTTARIVRAQTLALKRREFLEAARATGVPPAGILWRHIVPNVLGPVVVYATLIVPQMILFESFLSYLGLGVQEPQASLGNLIYAGAQEMETAPWMLLVPATALVLLLLCLNVDRHKAEKQERPQQNSLRFEHGCDLGRELCFDYIGAHVLR